MIFTIFTVVILFFVSSQYVSSEEINYIFRHYQVENGLSDNMVTSCVQDNNGYIWLGTRDGLNCFDGYNFKVYRHDPEMQGTLGSNWITGLNCDKDGNLWVGTFSGLFCFKQEKEMFSILPITADKRIDRFLFDNDNRLWVLMEGNLIRFDLSLDQYKIYSHPEQFSYTSLCLTANGKLWVGDSNGSLSIIEEDGTVQSYSLFENSEPRKILHLYPSSYNNSIFVAYEHDDIKIWNADSLKVQDLNIQSSNNITFLINCFLQIDENELWIGTDSGLIIYYLNTGKYKRVMQDPLDPNSLSSQYISAFCRDRENGIWICFHQSGVNYCSPFRPFRIHYPGDSFNLMQGEVVRDICKDKYGNIWLGTEDAGINCMDKQTGAFSNYRPGGNGGIAHTNIRGLAVSDNDLWIGHVIHGIDRMDINTRKVIKRYSLLKDSAGTKNSSVRCIKVLQEGDIYVGTDDGVFKYDYLNDCFKFMHQFPEYSVRCIYEDRLGRVWTGMFNRSFYYDPISNAGMYLPYDKLNTQRHNLVNDICEDTDGNMWFATLEGVIKYDFQTGESIHYTVKDGMPSNVVFRILRDNDRCFWISTANGLVRFDSKTEQITTFTENHGLISRQFNENSAFKDSDENFYFGSVKGFVHFRPEDMRMDVRHAKVHLHTLELDNGKKVINIPSESSEHKIELGHEESTFSINFSTLDFIAPASVKYAYRLSGSNQSWIEIGGRNTVYFANLSPGDYVFEVKATDFSNHWSDEVTSLNIVILPAWWQSTFARFLFVMTVFVMIISFIYRWKAKAKKEMAYNMQLFEDKKEKELYQSKIDFFINIAHEIRTPLTLIKNPLEKIIMSNVIQGKESESLRLMNRNVTRLMSLVNQLLDFRKTETDGYKLSFVRTDMIALLKENVKFFRESAAENNLLLNIDCTMDELYAYVDREAVTKIFSNLLLNAIKYAQHSIVIRVSMNEEYDSFSIDFINDGKPVPPELREKIFEPFYRVEVNTEGKTGTGLGLPFARSLAEMHNGSLTLETFAANEGLTMFRLVLPLHLPESIHTEENIPLSDETDLSLRFEEGRPAVLVVEDNSEMRKFVAEEVNTLYNVYVAENGKVATEILGKESVQLVISDVMMPVMDGLELLHYIKSNEEYTHIPVILLTAKTTTQFHLEGLEHGADAYIDKPFSMPLLMAQVSNLISNRDNIRKFYFKSPIANMKSIAYSKTDEKFLDKLNTIINDNMGNPDLDVNMLAEMMNISRPTLYRKVRSISDLTPNDLIKMARLKKSAELLLSGEMKIYEIAEAVGFSSQSYFWSAFIKEFGVSPSKYVKENMGKE